MIEIVQGDLFAADVDAIVNAVNTVGVMGKGLALQFKAAYPDNYRRYKQACAAGELIVGVVLTFDRGEGTRPRFILNVPTKKHFRSPSSLEIVEAGLAALVREVQRLRVGSVAVPALGCGLGGLAWRDVLPRISAAFADLDVRAQVHAPHGL